MSNGNPTATLTRRRIAFCLASFPKDADIICTRVDDHNGHCCDEVTAIAWDSNGKPCPCRLNHNHSAEKGLVRR